MNISKIITLAAVSMAFAATAAAAAFDFHPFSVPVSPPSGVIEGSAPFNAVATKQSGKTGPLRKGENNPMQPPFCETFDNFRKDLEYDDFDLYFDVIDSNKDERTWGFYNYAVDRPYGKCAYTKFPRTPGMAADDWLITRAVRLEKGKYYCVSVYAGLYLDDAGDTPQKFEVKLGTYNDAAGMKYDIVPVTNATTRNLKRVQGWFSPQFTANYYVGVHDVSPYYNAYFYNYLFIDNISIESPYEGTVPAEVTNVVMTNDPNGTPAVEIAFNAPSKSLDGKPLTSVTTVEVKRDGVLIGTVKPSAPGARCTLKDTPQTEGYYEYTFTATGTAGVGATYYQGHTSGISEPVPPRVTAYKELADGKIHIEWEAPMTDVNGNALNPDKITYTITDVAGEEPVEIASGINTLEYTYDPKVPSGWQKLVFCVMTAELNGKVSSPAVTDYLPVGTPYKLPYHNSFTYADYYDFVLSVEAVDGVSWAFYDDFSDPDPQDGDNGFTSMSGTMPGQSCELRTGKLDLRGAQAPLLTFYTYVYSYDENEIDVNVYDVESGKKTTVHTVKCGNYDKVDWNLISVSLKDFAGKVIILGLDGKIVTHGYIPVDNLTIKDMEPVDLTVSVGDYERQADPDVPFEITAVVFNTGRNKVSDYTVTLLDGKREVMTAKGPAVESLGTATVKLTDTFTAISPVSTDYRLRVDATGDTNSSNDISEPFTIVFLAPNYPAVTDLAGVEDEDGSVTLTWSAPDLSKAAPAEVTEDFEKYEPFDTRLDGWTMYDADGGYVGALSNLELPVSHTQQAFWILTREAEYDFVPTHSGYNVLAGMFGTSEDKRKSVANDDWLISPELYGGRQNISFYVISINDNYGNEEFEVYFSKTGKNIEDFEKALGVTSAPTDWTRMRISLPDGTKYFAVRYVSNDRFIFLMDDFTFIPAGTPMALTLKGYNVYRNGVKLNDAPLAETTYRTSRDKRGDDYFVTSVYDLGESVGSNGVHLGEVGIGNVSVEAGVDAPVEFFDLRGVKVNPASAVPGLYIRRAGSKVEKVIIK